MVSSVRSLALPLLRQPFSRSLFAVAMADQPGAETVKWNGGRQGGGWRHGGRSGGALRPPQPDHFISLRVLSEVAAPYFDAAHAALRSHAGGVLEPYLVEREAAHVTLAVVRLNGDGGKKSGSNESNEGEGEGGVGDGENAAESAARKTNRNASRPRQKQRDPLKVEAATRALVAAAKAISEALLEGGEGAEGGKGNEVAVTTTTVASVLLSNLSLAPELGTFGNSRGARVLWLRPDDGVEGRALAAAERAVARALQAEAAVLWPELSSSSASASAAAATAPPAQLWTPHVTLAKVRWLPANTWRRLWFAGGSRPPSSIPEDAHLGALDGLPRSSLFGAPELELCRIGGRGEGQYYEVVATALLTSPNGRLQRSPEATLRQDVVAEAAEMEEEERGG